MTITEAFSCEVAVSHAPSVNQADVSCADIVQMLRHSDEERVAFFCISPCLSASKYNFSCYSADFERFQSQRSTFSNKLTFIGRKNPPT